MGPLTGRWVFSFCSCHWKSWASCWLQHFWLITATREGILRGRSRQDDQDICYVKPFSNALDGSSVRFVTWENYDFWLTSSSGLRYASALAPARPAMTQGGFCKERDSLTLSKLRGIKKQAVGLTDCRHHGCVASGAGKSQATWSLRKGLPILTTAHRLACWGLGRAYAVVKQCLLFCSLNDVLLMFIWWASYLCSFVIYYVRFLETISFF